MATSQRPRLHGYAGRRTLVTCNRVFSETGSRGFSLIELLIAVALVGLLGTMAWPAWRAQKLLADEGLLVANIQSMAIFQEDYRIRYGHYATDLADRHTIATVTGWQPRHDDQVLYSITSGDGSEYRVYAENPAGHSVCLRMPAVQRCD